MKNEKFLGIDALPRTTILTGVTSVNADITHFGSAKKRYQGTVGKEEKKDSLCVLGPCSKISPKQ